jgi:PPOX class probable F420-dependent enzyme
MRRELRPPDLQAFLDEPLVAILATYRRDGTALLAPVWHEWRDGGFNVVIDDGDAKARNLRRDPRAGIVVSESDPPYRGVEAHGEPTLTETGSAEAFRRISVRYLGAESGNAYADEAGGGLLVRLVPEHLRSWDFADDF